MNSSHSYSYNPKKLLSMAHNDFFSLSTNSFGKRIQAFAVGALLFTNPAFTIADTQTNFNTKYIPINQMLSSPVIELPLNVNLLSNPKKYKLMLIVSIYEEGCTSQLVEFDTLEEAEGVAKSFIQNYIQNARVIAVKLYDR